VFRGYLLPRWETSARIKAGLRLKERRITYGMSKRHRGMRRGALIGTWKTVGPHDGWKRRQNVQRKGKGRHLETGGEPYRKRRLWGRA